MDCSLVNVIAELEKLFSKFNIEFFEEQLQKPIITVSQDITKGAYGWCTSWKAWQKGTEDGYYEINICAEYLNRPIVDTCETLLHEMVHLYNLYNDIKDTSRSGTYHNKKYKEAAELHGLIVEQSDKYGWNVTRLNEKALEYVKNLDKTQFDLFRTKTQKKSSTSSKGSSKKYVCPGCETIIRSTKEVSVKCISCDLKFEMA